MEGLCGLISTKRSKRGRIPVGVADDDDASHDGIKTVEVNNRCDFSNTCSDLCICIVTWNMNGQVSYEDIRKLVGNERKYDLLVIGLQEVPRRTNVLKLLQNSLLQSHVFLGKSVMQSLQLYMFGTKNSELHITEVKADKEGIGGCGGLIGRKKGAVAIRVTCKGIHMLFISCHLSAHGDKVEERNYECRHISHSLFSKRLNPYAKPTQLSVWLGDLNYRLRQIDAFPAKKLIHNNLHQLLTSKDQLLQEAERGQVFNGYCEGTLAFKPTYKYNLGTTDYDTSYKVRVPAWTDRILYKVEDKEINASLHLYESIEGIHSSDHKPVQAHLCLKLLNT